MNRSLICVILMLLPLLCLGQKIRLYTSEQGLPNSQINSVYQDGKGYIWVATDGGIAYFDGIRFTTFRHDQTKPNTIASDIVNDIFTDSKGECWIATSRWLQRFDYKSNSFRDFKIGRAMERSGEYISSVVEVPDYKMMLVAGGGISVFDAADTLSKNAERTKQLNTLFDNPFIGRMFVDSKNRVWTYFFDEGISFIDIKSNTKTTPTWLDRKSSDPSDIFVSAVAEYSSTGNIIVGTFNNGIFIYDSKLGHIRRAKGKSADKYRIRAIKKCANGFIANSRCDFLVGTEDSGLKVFNMDSEDIEDIKLPNCPIDITNCKAHSILEDNQGNIWVAIFQKGLLLIPKATYGFGYTPFGGQSKSYNYHNSICVTSIIEDRDRNLWVGTDGGGLYCVDKTGSTKNFNSANSSLINNSVMALAIDKSGALWISTYMGGINKLTAGVLSLHDKSREVQNISCFEYDPKGDILYAGTYGSGVVAITNQGKRQITTKESSLWVSAVKVDSSGNLWVASTDGTRCYDLISSDCRHTTTSQILNNSRGYAVLESPKNTFWIGSVDGLVRIDGGNGGNKTYTMRDGLPSNTIYSLTESLDGDIWIGTAYGLSRLNPATDEFRNFYSYDGIQENEFRFGSVYRSPSGKIYMGGINGMSSFYPNSIVIEERPIPSINFSRMTVFNKPVDFDESIGSDNILDRHISQASKATLKYSQNVFSIEFSVLEYTNPQRVVYGYMMEGFDNDWNFTKAENHTATYTNLPAGSYKFKVKAFFDGSQEHGTTTNELSIKILPPWYNSTLAYLMYLLLVLAAIWQLRKTIAHRRQREAERVELDMKEFKLRMFTDFSHEIRTPLTLIISPIEKLLKSNENKANQQTLMGVYRNSKRILSLVNQLLDIRKIDKGQMKLRYTKTDLVGFISELYELFEHEAKRKEITFNFESVSDELFVWIDRNNFDKVLMNVLANAFKFTPQGGKIDILLSSGIDNTTESPLRYYAQISVIDSGVGIDDDKIDKIFTRFYQAGNSAAWNSVGTGIGLNLSKTLVEMHQGTIAAANNAEGAGTSFSIRVPVGSEHLSEQEIVSAETAQLISRESFDDSVSTETTEHRRKGRSKTNYRILIVDDDDEIREFIRQELEVQYRTICCSNGVQAQEQAMAQMPDLIISDVMMPELDGFELLKRLKSNSNTSHIPIILLTSKTEFENKMEALDRGADAFLPKPFNIEELLQVVENLIKTRQILKGKFSGSAEQRERVTPVEFRSSDEKLMDKIMKVINDDLDNPELNVEALALKVGLSRVQLHRKLKEMTGLSVGEFMRGIRLRQAALLLVEKKMNISQIAYAVGFSNQTHFSVAFKKFYGVSPSEYIEHSKEDNKE